MTETMVIVPESSDLSTLASKSLGSANSYAVWTDKFDASLLNPIPRSLARDELGIRGDEWSLGYDVWNCHEATFLNDNGVPIAGTLKFRYSSNSDLMIESKSMKLYLNSFDMCKMGPSISSAIENYVNQISKDLSSALKTDVQCNFFSDADFHQNYHLSFDPLYESVSIDNELEYLGLHEQIVIDDYNGKTNHVRVERVDYNPQMHLLRTNTLRSRCRHTKQKDTGTALIWYYSKAVLSLESLLKEIVSMREMNKFHEETVEKAYRDIYNVLKSADPNSMLTVLFLYSRRGSLDISPIRSSHDNDLLEEFINLGVLSVKTQGQ